MAAVNNIKVGVTATTFAVITLGLVIWLSQYDPGKKSYTIQGNFTNIGGLIPGSKVYLMGVKIGDVVSTIPELNRVKVMLNIDDKIKIPTTTRLAIAAKGLVGDKSVEFFINDDIKPTKFYKPGDVIEGNSPASFDDVIIEGRKAMVKANALIGDPELNRNIRLTSKNVELFTRKLNESMKQVDGIAKSIKDISGSANGLVSSANGLITKTNTVVSDIGSFVGDVKGLTKSNSKPISSIISSSDRLAKSLEKTANTLNHLLDDPKNKKDFGSTASSIRKTAENIQTISQQATLISSDIRNLTNDKDIRNNLKDIVNNTKVISGTFANTLSIPQKELAKQKEKEKKDRLNLDFKSEILGKINYQFNVSPAPTFDIVGNFNILAHTGFERFPFLQIGIDEIGSKNAINLQAGFYPFDNFRARLGIVRGKLGVGGNYFINKNNTEILADFYDISSPHIRLGIMQNIYKDYGVSLYWDDQVMTNLNEVSLGVRWQPSIF